MDLPVDDSLLKRLVSDNGVKEGTIVYQIQKNLYLHYNLPLEVVDEFEFLKALDELTHKSVTAEEAVADNLCAMRLICWQSLQNISANTNIPISKLKAFESGVFPDGFIDSQLHDLFNYYGLTLDEAQRYGSVLLKLF